MARVVGWIEEARTRVPVEVREMAGVACTAALHLLWTALELPRGWVVVPIVLAWGAHLVVTARRDPGSIRRWGLDTRGLLPAGLATFALTCLAGAGMVQIGLLRHAEVTPSILLALVVYPLWGLVQQLLLQAMVTSPLERRIGARPAVVASALVFGLVHWPHQDLMLATILLGLALGPIWLRWRNLWPLAFAHGWLGTLLYHLVLGRDPLAGYL